MTVQASNLFTRTIVSMFMLLPACARERETLRIHGSTSSMPMMSALVAAYRAGHPRDEIILLTGARADERLQRVRAGAADVAVIERETGVDGRMAGLRMHDIARTGTLLGVRASFPIERISRRQLCDVYSGAVTNWRQLGGPDVPVKVGVRQPSEEDAGNPVAIAKCPGAFRFGQMVQMIEPPEMMAEAISGTAGGIGLTSLRIVEQRSGRIRALAVDGVAPTEENIADGRYPLARTTTLVTKDRTPRGFARLLSFVATSRGDSIIRAHGAVPVNHMKNRELSAAR